MGCTASKLENEDTVRRCKERRRFMKEAVYARHHLAAAHSDYCRSLRLTGSALSTFAAGEPLSVSDQTPAVFLRTPSNTAATTTTNTKHYQPPPIHVPSPSPSVHPPPPPPPISPSVHSSKLPHILSSPTHLRRKRPPPQPMKLPHILSDSSSFSSSPKRSEQNFTYHARANSTFSNTPSQDGSSVWNWEHFYPPSPPHSEYFEQLQTKKSNNDNNNSHHYLDEDEEADTFDDKSSNYTSYSRYSHNKLSTNVRDQKGRIETHPPPPDHHWESEEGEREEVQCGEWEDHDHYSTTSSSDIEGDDDEDDLRSRSDIGTRSNFSEAIGNMNGNGKGNSRAPSMSNVNYGVKHSTTSKLDKLSDDGESSWGYGNKGGDTEMNSDRRMVVRHKDLVEIVAAIKEYFDKAATGGQQVSEMLETGRAQIDRSFSQLKKTVYHSSGLLSNLSSSWSSKPPLAVKYKFEPMSIEQSGGTKSLCSTLERLFAWEKKLYEEVKARERVKIEHEKKLSTLQSQESKREEESKLDKTKTSINRLQSLITVTSQAVSSTSSAIITQRDSELVPQLVELCHGFMYMWRSMNQYHEVQNDIVQQVRGLINRSIKGELTSDLHRQATRDLESAVSTWHSSFCRLIKFQRDFIRSLHGWFKLSLTPVNIETNHGKRDTSDAFSFCDEWKLALDRIPDTVASEAIKSFINVVHSISLTQTEEMKVKKRTETASKELEKKASSVRSIERKYYNEFSMVGLGLPGTDDGHGLDNRDPLSDKKAELAACQRRVEDELVKHSKAVEVTRAMTLNNLQTGLPGVFQAMTSFSALITEALEAACTRSYAIK